MGLGGLPQMAWLVGRPRGPNPQASLPVALIPLLDPIAKNGGDRGKFRARNRNGAVRVMGGAPDALASPVACAFKHCGHRQVGHLP